MSCIIEQHIHYRSKKNIFTKALEASGLKELTLESFEQFEKEGLNHLKLSERKFETINNTIDFFRENTIDFDSLTEIEIRNTLSTIKGIGPWTVSMILIYTLDFRNIFEPNDYHIKKAMKQQFGFEKPSDINKFADIWSPYKSYAFRILAGA